MKKLQKKPMIRGLNHLAILSGGFSSKKEPINTYSTDSGKDSVDDFLHNLQNIKSEFELEVDKLAPEYKTEFTELNKALNSVAKPESYKFVDDKIQVVSLHSDAYQKMETALQSFIGVDVENAKAFGTTLSEKVVKAKELLKEHHNAVELMHYSHNTNLDRIVFKEYHSSSNPNSLIGEGARKLSLNIYKK